MKLICQRVSQCFNIGDSELDSRFCAWTSPTLKASLRVFKGCFCGDFLCVFVVFKVNSLREVLWKTVNLVLVFIKVHGTVRGKPLTVIGHKIRVRLSPPTAVCGGWRAAFLFGGGVVGFDVWKEWIFTELNNFMKCIKRWVFVSALLTQNIYGRWIYD